MCKIYVIQAKISIFVILKDMLKLFKKYEISS
jgi:hypothetical protein